MTIHSEKTKESYRRWISWLQKEFNDGKDGLEFLKDIDRIVAGIEDTDYSEGSKKVIYTAILSTLRDREGFGDVFPLYQVVFQEYKTAQDERAKSQKPTEKQQEAYVPWKELQAAVEKQFEKMSDMWQFQDYLIMALYTMNAPVRLDYTNMSVVRSAPEDTSKNYCVMGPRTGEFIFNKFKTSHAMGQQRIKIAPKLYRIIKEWLKLSTDPTTLLLNKDGTPMTENVLGKRITELFQEHTGKKVSLNAIRHSYSTHYHKKSKSIKVKEEAARQMLHSAPMNEQYAYKN